MKKFLIIFTCIIFPTLFSSEVFAQTETTQQTQREKKAKEKLPPLTSQVIVISLDGLRIEDLKNPKLNLPTLKYLLESGASVRNLECVYPSAALPAYASLLTGMYPSDHGITGENLFDEKLGKSGGGKFPTATEIKSDSILLAAQREALQVKAWNFLLTENIEGKQSATTFDLVSDFLTAKNGMRVKRPAKENSSVVALEGPVLRLGLVRFSEYADAQKKYGVNSLEANKVLEKIDAALADIFAKVEQTGLMKLTTWLIVATHGFAKVEQEFRPNLVLAKKGFLTADAQGNINSWIATARSSGGAAAIYLQDPNELAIKDVQKVFTEIQQQEASPIWRVIEKKDVAKMGGDPRAAFFIEAAPGYLISEQATGKKFTEKLTANAPKAISGYAASRSEMRGLLLATGQGIKPKTQIEYARIIDLAPTIARLLGIELKASRGHAISSILNLPLQK